MSWSGLTILDVVAGAASIYGAIVTWIQKRQVIRTGAAVSATELRVRELLRRLNAHQAVGEGIRKLRLAEFVLSMNAASQAGVLLAHLADVNHAVVRLAADSQTRNLLQPIRWIQMENDIRKIRTALLAAPYPIPAKYLAAAQDILCDAIANLDRLSVTLMEKLGDEHARDI